MKKIFFITFLLFITIVSCKKSTYKDYQGTYDIKSNGTLSILSLDTTFVDELGMVIIRRGESSDEIFMYVETKLVTGTAPLGVYATAKIDGNTYKMEARNVTINIADFPLSTNISATGVLSDDNKTLTSVIVFTGIISGTMKSIGIKRE